MSQRLLVSMGALAIVSLVALPVAGQAPAAAGKGTAAKAKTWTPPRTPDGQPDLQGVWTSHTRTPLERPRALAGKQFFTDEEVAAQEAEAKARFEQPIDRAPGKAGEPDERIVGAYNDFWSDRYRPTKQTSLVVDPPDGRIPLTEEAQKEAARPGARSTWEWAYNNKVDRADSWEDRNLWERCITRGLPGAMMPAAYNDTYQILQTPGYVAILVEMIHDVRIIRLDGRPHLPQRVRQWMGDSRGHWEGHTLVVETTNFTDKVTDRTKFVFGAHETARLVERFTRVDADTIDYEFTIEDPQTFTQPWTAKIPMSKIDAPVYEYACHEGNTAITMIFGGARADENGAAERAKQESR